MGQLRFIKHQNAIRIHDSLYSVKTETRCKGTERIKLKGSIGLRLV